ncbi:MAG: hypothetical protein AABZ24_08490, partial [Nitrospirota bacterium]
GLRGLFTDEPDNRPGQLRLRDIDDPQFRHRSLFPISEYCAQRGHYLISLEITGHTEDHPVRMNRVVMEGDEIVPRDARDRIQRTLSGTRMSSPIEHLGKFTADDRTGIILTAADPLDRLQFD